MFNNPATVPVLLIVSGGLYCFLCWLKGNLR